MHIAVIGTESRQNEFAARGNKPGVTITRLKEPIPGPEADCYIDLDFEPDPDRVVALQSLQPSLIIINDVVATLAELPRDFVRFNGWPGFLRSDKWEAAAKLESEKNKVNEVAEACNRTVCWVHDQPGFITARIVSMIINEAWFALEEGVSTKSDIDLAMKTGTNYPFGPFEWCEMIGGERVAALLKKLSQSNPRYTPAPGLLS
jgi:3-hydroxybutyryl-CoA dehydrogenase